MLYRESQSDRPCVLSLSLTHFLSVSLETRCDCADDPYQKNTGYLRKASRRDECAGIRHNDQLERLHEALDQHCEALQHTLRAAPDHDVNKNIPGF